MPWDPLALVFLGTIALASLVQTALLVGFQIPEVEGTVEKAARRVRHAGEVAERLFVRPFAAAALALALFRAFRGISPAGALLKLRGR